jgi:hypothetical protein
MALARASVLLAGLALGACSQVASVRFGLINQLGMTETRHIPYVVGTHYGFRIDYHDTGHPVTLREQFDLPGPASWHSTSPPEQRMLASRSGRTVTREVQLGSHTRAPPDIHSFYIEDIQIARGDPKGEYSVKLWLDDKSLKDFQFYIE